jgi:hypothetical protein
MNTNKEEDLWLVERIKKPPEGGFRKMLTRRRGGAEYLPPCGAG